MWSKLGQRGMLRGQLNPELQQVLISERTEREIERRLPEEVIQLQHALAAGGVHLDDKAALEQVMRERFSLRADRSIVQVLHAWWDTACWTAGSGLRHAVALGREDYAKYLRPVCKALSDEYDPDEVEEAVIDDWEADCRGRPLLTRELFCDKVFEVANLHAKAIDNDVYCDFLWRLLHHVSYEYGTQQMGDVVLLSFGEARKARRIFKEPADVGPLESHPEVEHLDPHPSVEHVDQHGADPNEKAEPPSRDPSTRRQGIASPLMVVLAALKLQAAARGRAVRAMASARRNVAIAIQSVERGRLARKKANKRRSSGVTIQAHFRARCSRLTRALLLLDSMRTKQHSSAVYQEVAQQVSESDPPPEAIPVVKSEPITHEVPNMEQQPRYMQYKGPRSLGRQQWNTSGIIFADMQPENEDQILAFDMENSSGRRPQTAGLEIDRVNSFGRRPQTAGSFFSEHEQRRHRAQQSIHIAGHTAGIDGTRREPTPTRVVDEGLRTHDAPSGSNGLQKTPPMVKVLPKEKTPRTEKTSAAQKAPWTDESIFAHLQDVLDCRARAKRPQRFPRVQPSQMGNFVSSGFAVADADILVVDKPPPPTKLLRAAAGGSWPWEDANNPRPRPASASGANIVIPGPRMRVTIRRGRARSEVTRATTPARIVSAPSRPWSAPHLVPTEQRHANDGPRHKPLSPWLSPPHMPSAMPSATSSAMPSTMPSAMPSARGSASPPPSSPLGKELFPWPSAVQGAGSPFARPGSAPVHSPPRTSPRWYGGMS